MSRTSISSSSPATVRRRRSTPARRRGSRAPRPTPPSCRTSATSGSPNSRRCCTPTAAAGDNRKILLVLQGMDTAGKGGIVKHVVGAGNPQGIKYASFGKPTEEELAHDFLWRIEQQLPTAGHIGVFDRSHYEDVLIVRVHDLVPPDVWGTRYDDHQRLREAARRRRHDDRQGGDVRLARRAEEATGRAARAAGQVLEVQPGRRRRAPAVAAVPGGIPGDAGADVDRLRALARRSPATASGTAAWPSPSC